MDSDILCRLLCQQEIFATACAFCRNREASSPVQSELQHNTRVWSLTSVWVLSSGRASRVSVSAPLSELTVQPSSTARALLSVSLPKTGGFERPLGTRVSGQ
jgi:hypothetical protein